MQAKNMASSTLSPSILRISTKFLNGDGRHIRPITKRVETKEEEEVDASLSDLSSQTKREGIAKESKRAGKSTPMDGWKEGERDSGVLFFPQHYVRNVKFLP